MTSQGDPVLNADVGRSSFGVNGSGIRIGVISDSFGFQGSAAVTAQVIAGDLPVVGNPNGFSNPVMVVKDAAGAGNLDEGRAMAEIIHDIAPGAEIYFHSAFNNGTGSPNETDQTIAAAINNLVAAGCNVIVDDVGINIAPFFQTGFAAQAVNTARANGVAYFSAAGNSGDDAWQGRFSSLGGFHNFDVNNNETGIARNLLTFTIPAGRSATAVLQWSDPYGSVGPGAFEADYDLGFFEIVGNDVSFLGSSSGDQAAGDDPWEAGSIDNPTGMDLTIGLAVQNFAGEADELMRILLLGESFTDDDDNNASTIFGHPMAAGGVGAAASFHLFPDNVNFFSSYGPGLLLFDENGVPVGGLDSTGNPVGALVGAPQLTAPDGVTTTTDTSGIGGVDFGVFFGTSAAAPHAAAVAALVLERAAQLGISLTPDQLYQLLFSTATDIEAPGFDNRAGFGRINAFAALAAVPEPSSLALLALGLIALRRRSLMS